MEIDKNFIWDIKFVTSENVSCDDQNCVQKEVCRCSVINDFSITFIDINTISKRIYNHFYVYGIDNVSLKRDRTINNIVYNYDEDFDLYCVNRLVRINKLYEPSKWTHTIEKSYYGEEVKKIEIEESVYNMLISDIQNIKKLKTIKEKSLYLLNREYGYILPGIEDKKFSIFSVNKKYIYFSNTSQIEKVIKEDRSLYLNDIPIKGVCIKDGDYWRVLDGYHRLYFSYNDSVKIIGLYD